MFVRVDRGDASPLGEIASFDATNQRVTIRSVDQEHFDEVTLSPGDIVEIDCRLEAPVLATRLALGIPLLRPLPPIAVRLGTTRGTNALLTRSGARTALVTTLGFGDVLEIGQQDRPELFDLAIQKPWPLTATIVEVAARMDRNGVELVPLDESWVAKSLRTLHESGVDAVAISLLHGYLNPKHERAIEAIAREIGFTAVSRSSEVAPLIKLVSRTETTTLDAYLNPLLDAYVQRIEEQFGGPDCQLRLMTSGGNLVDRDDFRGRDSVSFRPRRRRRRIGADRNASTRQYPRTARVCDWVGHGRYEHGTSVGTTERSGVGTRRKFLVSVSSLR